MARATEAVLVRFAAEELAAIDRVLDGVPRTVWIKRLCADAVLARETIGGSARPTAGEARELQVVEGAPRRGRLVSIGAAEEEPAPVDVRPRRVLRIIGAPRNVPPDPNVPVEIPGQTRLEEMIG